jgi:predicted acetyltransferase
MIKRNIENLTSLWKLSLGSGLHTYDHDKISFGWINNSDWPNRIWINGVLTKEILDKVHDKMRNAPLELTFSYFDIQISNEQTSMIEHMLEERSVQHGMQLKLTNKYDYETCLTFKKVKTKQDAQVWSEVFYKSFKYSINSETVYKTFQDVEYFTVHIKNKEIGTIALYFHADVAGVHSLSVIPEERRKGYAKDITLFILNRAHDAKAKIVTLQASKSAKNMYQGLGFSTEFLMRNYRLK